MQSSLNLEEMLRDWSPNTGDDTSILGTQKIPFLLHNVLGGCLHRKLLNIIGQKMYSIIYVGVSLFYICNFFFFAVISI